MSTRMRRITRFLSLTLLAFAACGGDEGSEAGVEGTDPPFRPLSGLERTLGTADRARTTALIAEIRANLNMLEAVGGEETVRMLPGHRQRVENLLAQTGGEMSGDAQWSAVADSVRRDLTRMQGMAAAELDAFTAGHASRVRRLLSLSPGGR